MDPGPESPAGRPISHPETIKYRETDASPGSVFAEVSG